MKAKKIEMPEVEACKVAGCFYNRDQECHAKAITIGDLTHPKCDTFLHASAHTQSRTIAGVGACKMTSCRYNSDFECQTDAIDVDSRDGAANCLTFEEG